MTTVKLGSTGPDVTRLSVLLGLSPRNVCDKEMVEVMKSYQSSWGLLPDGIFGYKSWKSILISERYSKNSDGSVTDSDYVLFASLLGCESEMIKAFVQVESSGSGFLNSGRPIILFESYQFYRNLKSEGIDPQKYISLYPDIITTKWVKNYLGSEKEWTRLEKARSISKSAADKSTSWGLLQILGSNYQLCGEPGIAKFVSDMEKDEFTQLSLGIDFIKSSGVVKYMINKDFKGMAKTYNGPGYAANKYDLKLKNAYYKLKRG